MSSIDINQTGDLEKELLWSNVVQSSVEHALVNQIVPQKLRSSKQDPNSLSSIYLVVFLEQNSTILVGAVRWSNLI
jgi:hypothetical protein